jgi:hypothetical protein
VIPAVVQTAEESHDACVVDHRMRDAHEIDDGVAVFDQWNRARSVDARLWRSANLTHGVEGGHAVLVQGASEHG